MATTVTSQIQGITINEALKTPVRAVSTANLTLSGLQTVGGVALAADDRVLVKDQTTTTQNGIYAASTGSWTRTKDFDGNRDARKGTLILVEGSPTLYRVTTSNPIIIGTSSIAFEALGPTQTQGDIGLLLYPRTAAEIAAGVTPANYAYSPEIANARRYGPAIDGVTDDSAELSNASAGAAGKIILLPKGTYLVTSTWTLSAGTTYIGEGPGTIIKMQSSQLAATDLAGITFRNLKVVGSVTGAGLIFVRCDDLNFEDVTFDNTIGGANPGGTTAVWLKGCDNVHVNRCRFINQYNGVYCGDDSIGEKCGTVRVTNSHFEHTFLSAGSYPTGVYQYQCDHLFVDRCTFKNIFPGGADPSPFGYCVYEGDGTSKSTSVTNCVCINTTVAGETGSNVFAQASNTIKWTVEKNYYDAGGQPGQFVNGSAVDQTIVAGNYVKASYMILQPGDANTLNKSVVVDKNHFELSTQGVAVIRIGANAEGFNYATVTRNIINGATGGGIFVNVVTKYATIDENTVIDVNSDNTAYSAGNNEFQVSAMSFFGSTFGVVSRNYCENTNGGAGRADFGFACWTAAHSIDVRPDNRFLRMDTAPTLNGIKVATNIQPWHQPGAVIWFTDPVSGGPAGRVCTDYRRTTISVNEAAGQTVISVTSETGIAANDQIAIELNTGVYHYTSVASVGPLTISAALPSAADAGREVITNEFKAMANLA